MKRLKNWHRGRQEVTQRYTEKEKSSRGEPLSFRRGVGVRSYNANQYENFNRNTLCGVSWYRAFISFPYENVPFESVLVLPCDQTR